MSVSSISAAEEMFQYSNRSTVQVIDAITAENNLSKCKEILKSYRTGIELYSVNEYFQGKAKLSRYKFDFM